MPISHPYAPTADLSHFYVITVISNSARYERRYELYWKFKELMDATGVKLITVEHQLGHRPFMVTEGNNPYHVQVRSVEELWIKENLIDVGRKRVMQIDPKAREVAWIDADTNPVCSMREWLEETWHALQHYEVVQMWEWLINYGPQYQPESWKQLSFMASYAAAGFQVPKGKAFKHTLAGHSGVITLGRPGLAWAANISALDAVGGLIDWCILGSGDWHMAHGLVGAMEQGEAYENKLSAYSEALFEWQEKCERWIKRDVGYVKVTCSHWFHGNKADRQYPTRGKILVENGYNPHTDIKYDSYGVLQLETHTPRQIRLRDMIRGYFATRNEDFWTSVY